MSCLIARHGFFESVFLYAKTRKMFYSTKDMLVSEREILDEESIFSRCRRILIRQDEKNVFFAKRSAQKVIRLWFRNIYICIPFFRPSPKA